MAAITGADPGKSSHSWLPRVPASCRPALCSPEQAASTPFPTHSLGPAVPRQTFAFHEDHKGGVELVGGQLFLEVKRPLPFNLIIGDAVVLVTPPHRATLTGEHQEGRSYGPGREAMDQEEQPEPHPNLAQLSNGL